VAFLVPVGLTITAIIIGEGAFYDWFYSYGWFTGSTLGGLIYYLACRSGVGGALAPNEVQAIRG